MPGFSDYDRQQFSRDFRNNTLEMADLRRVVKESNQIASKALSNARGAAGGGGFMGGAGLGGAAVGAGFAISAARQIGSAFGPIGSTAANVATGFASGGVVGGLTAAASGALGLAQRLGEARQQGALSAPLFSDAATVKRFGEAGLTGQVLSEMNKFNAPFEGSGLKGPMRFGGGDPLKIQRFLNEEQERRQRPLEDALARTQDQLGGFVARGGQVPDEALQEILRFNLEQGRRVQKLREDSRLIGGRLNATTYGHAEQNGPK